jgi:competence ComEA-like helix-hairpin-helix protein
VSALTPDERRGGLVLVLLLLIGAGWDTWRAIRPRFVSPDVGEAAHADAGPGPGTAAEGADAGAADSADRVARQSDRATALDLNAADERALETLPGIGPVLANRIVEHRRINGRYRNVDELRAVRGVGPRLIERLRPRVVAGP